MKGAKIDRMHEESLEEAFTTKEIRQAVGIATDKRYAGGNMTGATQAIEKLKKGLSKHPQVRAVLRRVNEAYRKPTAAEIAADKRKDGKKPEGNRQSRIKKKVYGNAMGGLKEGAVSVSTVEKEIRSNGGSKIKKTDRSIEFMYRGSAHTIPLDRGFVRDNDYMKLQNYFG